jgi:hypothetical protein
MTVMLIILWALGVFAFGAGIAKHERWLIAIGLITQALVLWESSNAS